MQPKKIIIVLVLIILIVSCTSIAYAEDQVEPRDWSGWISDEGELKPNAMKTASTAIVVDINSGRIIYSKEPYSSRYPASITKIMTCLIAIENSDMTEVVTVTNEMYDAIKNLDVDSSLSDVKQGEIIIMKDLLYGLMLKSGNDAAVVVAYYIGGSYENFIAMMNAKAAEINMFDTSYVNPHGLPDERHLTSARDMALLAMYAKQYPEFEEIVATQKYKPADTNMNTYSDGSAEICINSNKLLNEDSEFYYQYATGIKTGYTIASKHTLVASAKKGEQSLVAVVLKNEKNDMWINSVTLFDYAFDFYGTIDIYSLFIDNQITATVENADMETTGNQLTLSLGEVAQEDRKYITEQQDIIDKILANTQDYFTETITYTNGTLSAPIQAGEQVGTVTYKYNYSHNADDYLGYMAAEGDVQYFEITIPLVANNAISEMVLVTPQPETTVVPTEEPNNKITIFKDMELWQVSLIAIGVLFIVLIVLLIILASGRNGPSNRYPDDGNSRHSHDNRGGSTNRRRH